MTGYLKFASILQQNCIKPEPLSLLGTNTVPGDCNLLVIAGPRDAIPDAELEKIEHYLNQGGRLLALFNFGSVRKDTGLERMLAKWGVDVGHNAVTDPDNAIPGKTTDLIVINFGNGEHPVVNSLLGSGLHVSLPRTVGRLKLRAEAADAPRVEEIAFSGPRASTAGDLVRKPPFPLVVAVEKGALKDVITERGSTRMIVVGDSLFLGNLQIESAANRDFAAAAVNWLLERTQVLAGLGPRPITQYKIVMTKNPVASGAVGPAGGLAGLGAAHGRPGLAAAPEITLPHESPEHLAMDSRGPGAICVHPFPTAVPAEDRRRTHQSPAQTERRSRH